MMYREIKAIDELPEKEGYYGTSRIDNEGYYIQSHFINGAFRDVDLREWADQENITWLKATGWISVKDDLPEKAGDECSDYVLTCNDSGCMDILFYDYDSKSWGDIGVVREGVTHWLIIPKNPNK